MKSRLAACALTVMTLAAAHPALAETTRVYTTPAPIAAEPGACVGDVDCEADLAGAPTAERPERVWTVRSAGAPATEDPEPVYPVSVFVGVDAEDYAAPPRPGVRPPRLRPHPPQPHRD
jgi:hypothetical protein